MRDIEPWTKFQPAPAARFDLPNIGNNFPEGGPNGYQPSSRNSVLVGSGESEFSHSLGPLLPFVSYTYTNKGNPLTVSLPDDVGDYEARYFSGQDGVVLGAGSLTVTAD
ncbi:hypothetical protein [Roseovarius sp. ZX-A-9]|uniref:hypothetical protein n=1 Tax=Roseovarius sp. ZX-A-9 TaxID=3014783 RepID=UPI00232FEB43|nr:hypothetical protein [Roseovarius sp. ZX-A-9]